MTDDGSSTWIGIDLGTSHCSSAIWDSSRGDAKWIRLPSAIPHPSKWGRILPSTVLLIHREWVPKQLSKYTVAVEEILTLSSFPLVALVGFHATPSDETSNDESPLLQKFSTNEIANATISSAKRFLGHSRQDWMQHFNVTSHGDSVAFQVTPLGNAQRIHVTPTQALAILLKAIKEQSELYLQKYMRKKGIRIPGELPISHAVVGVPASYTQRQRKETQRAAELAGFASTDLIVESTAAAMAYGLSFTGKRKTILVFDMGGGTTDITVFTLPENKIILVAGDGHLGGDDMDTELQRLVQQKIGVEDFSPGLRLQCRRAKEKLCGDVDHGYTQPSELASLSFEGQKYSISHEELLRAISPILGRVKGLVLETLSGSDRQINEVILVGGATRVPAVRQLLKECFPSIPELCVSVNAMSAVGKGAAIRAAIVSGYTPTHEISSALMIETTPYPIGVLLDDGSFVEVISRYTELPASGQVTFQLARKDQGGVSVNAVELVDDGTYSEISRFTFLLRKCDDDLEERFVDIHMKLDEHGQFIVRTFDPLDPEHKDGGSIPRLFYEDDKVTREQIVLFVLLIGLFLLYISAKIIFHEVEITS